MDPPRFPSPKFSRAHVCHETGVGYLVASHASGRRFFCAEDSSCVPTQFNGSVSKCYELTHFKDNEEDGEEDEDEDEEQAVVAIEGMLYRYCPSRPMCLKTCSIDVLRMEAEYQNHALGDLHGEDPVKEVGALQLLQGQSHHNNVEELEEAMVDDNTLYKVTPWYEGGELFDLAPMPERSAKTVFAQLLDALDYVHSRGVCHRDISLENILMDTRIPERSSASRSSSVSSIGSCISVASSTGFGESSADGSISCGDGGCGVRGSVRDFIGGDSFDACPEMDRKAAEAGEWIGRPRLCDFGMSVRIPRSPATGKSTLVTPQGRCGKNTCVAPEVFYDQVFDAEAVDTWSLGTTLFMALLGVQPWEEIGDYKFQAIAEGKNLDVVLQGWKLRDVISQDAVDLLQAMLTADPEERLSDIKSILAHPWFQN